MTVTILTGPSGAGKTTVAALLATRADRPTVNLTTDTFYRSIATGFVAPYLPAAHRQNETVVAAVVAAVAAYARGGYDVVVDGVVGPWFLGPFEAAARRERWDLAYVVLRPAADVVVARGTARPDGELTDPEALAGLHAAFADLPAHGRTDLEAHALDTGAETPAQTAARVREGVAAGRFRLPAASPAHDVEPQRTEPPLRADEATTLRAYLDYHRDTLRRKTSALTADQLRTPLPPSDMTLGGLLKHLAYVESHWFRVVLVGADPLPPFDAVDWGADPDWEWHSAARDTPAGLRDLFDAAVAASDRTLDEALASPAGLDRLSAREAHHGDGTFSLRWILVHLIEEYARHNGHADLLREAVDGTTGE